MSIQNGAPGVTVEEVDDSQTIVGASTSIGSFLGIAERGPVDIATLVTSWSEFKKTFGSFISNSYLAYSVYQYFQAGGGAVYVIRVTAHDVDNLSLAVASSVTLQTLGGGATKGRVTGTVAGVTWQGTLTWRFTAGNKVSFKVDGAAKVTVTLAATAATKAMTNAATFVLADLRTILYKLTASQVVPYTLTFHTADFVDITNATVQEVENVLARDLIGVQASKALNVITLKTDKLGTGAYLEFTGGTAIAALGIIVEVKVGTGNVVDIDHVTAAELNTLANVADPGITVGSDGSSHAYMERDTAGVTKTVAITTDDANETAGAGVLGWDILVHAGTSNTATDTLKLTAKTPGTFGDNLTADVAFATLDPDNKFRLTIKESGVVKFSEDELSMDPDSVRYVETVLASNRYIVADDLLAVVADQRPAVATGSAFAGGDDGLAGIADIDYSGDSDAKTGLHALDGNGLPSFVGAPGNTSRPWLVDLFAYCTTRKDLLAVGDVPMTLLPSEVRDFRMATGAYVGGAAFDDSYGDVYHNWQLITDPLTKKPKYLPPMGWIFACFVRTDRESVWRAPAGPNRGQMIGSQGQFATLNEEDIGVIYSAGVNPIINHETFGFVIWGQKDLQGTPSDLDRINVRRGFIFLRKSLKPAFEKATMFEPNDAITWEKTRLLVKPFMKDQVRARGVSAWKFVNDTTTNTPSDLAQHKMNPQLFVKATPDAEFVNVQVISTGQEASL